MIKKIILCSSVFVFSHGVYAQQQDTSQGILYKIPRAIDATPTFLPQQSNHPIVPSTQTTEDRTWIDQQQKGVRHWVDGTAHKIDDWFGVTNPSQPASATLRILLDNKWDDYDGYEIRPRIRGKIELPTLEKRFSVVFGDDSLDDQLKNQVAITNENPSLAENKNYDQQRTREDNSSIALRWSNFSKKYDFETDADVGIRSGDDVYLRLKAEKDWQLQNDFVFHAEQIYRYGSDSENYLRTNLELLHQRKNEASLSNQFALVYADASEDDLNWSNYTFRQHQFFQGNRFNYGVYSGGYYNDNQLRLDSWGPFVSWRQPVLREWFFVQTDLNYFNEDRENQDHHVSALLRLEALF
ncbi:hypothetical protein [uncultured Acinetobacter sp.]|uniref:hypothetical protein n=1 Tax=uncultured Acinetobacter sp. TaxID=165433 RepID=UPI00262898E5|nr:hypothetical protein [uncultured Acinetobacter sp.]